MITHRVKDALILAAVVTFLIVGIAEATYSTNVRPVRLDPFLHTHHHTAAPQMTLNRSAAAVGGTVVATGSQFVLGDTVELRLDSVSGALLASTKVMGIGGSFTLGFPVPASAAPGPHVVHAVVFGNSAASAPLTVGLLVRTDPNPAVVALGGGPVDVRIMIDAGAQHLDAAQVRLGFDPARLQGVDTDGNSANGVQLVRGVFNQVLTNQVDNAAGVIEFAGGRSLEQPASSGTVLLATVRLRGLALGAWPLTVVPSGVELAFNSGIVPSVGADGVVQVVANRLVFIAQPVRTAAGADFGLQPAVALVDGSGAVVTSDSSTVVTLGLAPDSGPPGASLTCASGLVKPLSAGVAAFTGCQVTPPGGGYRLTATGAPAGAPLTAPFNATLAGDTGGDCRVSAVDFSLVVTHFSKNAAHLDWTGAAQAFRSDLNGDGRTSVLDFSTLVSNFGRTVIGCAPPSDLPTVGIQSFAFLPANLSVLQGATVIWLNFDAAAHTTTADSGLWNSGQLATGRSFAYTFAMPGLYTYFCQLHPSMRGTIAVLEVGTITPPPPGSGGGGGSSGGSGGGGGSIPPPVGTAAETQHSHDAP